MWHSNICEERKTSIKTMDEGLFITESSGRSKYDEDKITKLITVINIYASKIEELMYNWENRIE